MLCCVLCVADGLSRQLDEDEFGFNIDFREYSFLNNTLVRRGIVQGSGRRGGGRCVGAGSCVLGGPFKAASRCC